MTGADPWQTLQAELDLWAQAGRRAAFWLRDDDATEPTPALDPLLGVTRRHQVPLLLAVIPEPARAALADRLRQQRHVSVALHGWAHANHAPPSEKKQEFGPQRPQQTMLAEIERGRLRLETLFGSSFTPVFVPPWNRIDGALAARLPEAGIAMLSTFGQRREGGAVRQLNSTVDIIDWHGTRKGRDAADLIAEIVEQLRQAFAKRSGAVGVLTHHLVHDDAAWRFLDRLLAATARHPACRWGTFVDLAAEGGAG